MSVRPAFVSTVALVLVWGLGSVARVDAASLEGPTSSRQVATKTKLTATLADATIDSGQTALVRGTLKAGQKRLRDKKVTLHQKVAGANTFTRVAKVVTKKRGVWKIALPKQVANSQLQARFAGNATFAKSRSNVLTLTVVKTDTPTTTPVIVTASLPDGTVGTPYDVVLGATASTPPTWSLASGALPPGLALSTDGHIRGTPSTATTASFTVRATNATGADTQPLTLRVLTGPPATPPLSITTGTLPDANEETPYSTTLAASGGHPPVAWSVSSGTLPTGLTLSSDGTIAGTPSVEGTVTFTVRAVDAPGAVATRALALNVRNLPFQILTTSLPTATQGTPYDVGLVVSGAEGTLSWSVLPGRTLPAGLTLSADGRVTGTPTSTGNSSFGIEVIDSILGSTSATISLNINAAPQPVFLDTTLPGGQVGVGYAYPVRVVGGTGPYTWSVLGGALPGGTTLNTATGVIVGVPTVLGTGSVTLRAVDATGTATTRTLSFDVTADTEWPQAGANAEGTLSSPGEQTMTPSNVAGAHEEWSFPGGDLSRVADGILFYAGDGVGARQTRGISAYDLATGKVLWSRLLPLRGGQSDYCERLAVTASHVVCQTSFDVVAVARGGNHEVTWRTFETDPGGFYTALLVSGDLVLTVRDGTLTAYGLSDGQPRWSRFLPEIVRGLMVTGGRLFTSDDGGELRTFTLSTGAPGWVATDAVNAYSPPIAIPGRNELLSVVGRDVAWRSVDTGTVLRTWTSPRGIRGTIAADAQRAYVPTGQRDPFGDVMSPGVTGVRHGDASERWHIPTNSPVQAGIAVAGELVWIHSSDNADQRKPSKLIAVDAATGTTRRSLDVPDTSSYGPQAAGGRVIVTSSVIQVVGIMAPPVRAPFQTLPTGWTGRSYNGTLSAEGGTAPFVWSSVSGSLPAGLSLASNGTISGTPTSIGVASFRVRVTDKLGTAAERDVRLAVRTTGPSEWRTMGGGPGRTGVALTQHLDPDVVAGFGLRYSTATVPPTAGGQNGSGGEEPLVVQDRIYGVLGQGVMHSWPTTGTGVPPLATRTLPDGEMFLGTPALEGTTSTGTLYAVTSHSRLVALDAATLNVLWSVPAIGNLDSLYDVSPLVIGDLVLVTVGGEVVAVNTTSKAEAWRTPLNAGYPVGSHALSTDGTRVYSYAGCEVVALRVTDGQESWRSTLQWNGSTCVQPEPYWAGRRVAPVVFDGAVYASNIVDGTAAFDAATGAVLWRNRLVAYNPTPLVSENLVVLTEGYLSAVLVLDRQTGQLIRASTLAEVPAIQSSATLVGDLLFFWAGDRMTAVDVTTLETAWLSPSQGTPSTGAIVAHRDRVYAYKVDGQVVGFGPPG